MCEQRAEERQNRRGFPLLSLESLGCLFSKEKLFSTDAVLQLPPPNKIDGFNVVAPADEEVEEEDPEDIPDYVVNSLVDIDGECVSWLAKDKAAN